MGNYTEWPSRMGLASREIHRPRTEWRDSGPSGAQTDTAAGRLCVQTPAKAGPDMYAAVAPRNMPSGTSSYILQMQYMPKGHTIPAPSAAAATPTTKPDNTTSTTNTATTPLDNTT